MGINIIVIFIVLCLVLYFSLKDNFQEIITCITKMNYQWFILGIIFLILYRTLIGISSHFVAKLNNSKISLLRCIQINFIILFFHGVTPFAGGGQPMEIYYLHNEKISITKATNIVLQNFMVYQVALILIGTISVFYNHYFHLFPDDSLIKKLVLLGFTINVLVLIAIFIFSFCKKINEFICDKGVKILAKFKIVSSAETTRQKLTEYLNNFHKNAQILKKHKLEVTKIIFINFLALLAQYSVSFAVIYGLGYHQIDYLNVIVTTAYVMIIGSFVPIPGGTGGIEYGYMFFFGYLMSGSLLTASMLIWRLISYYLGMIIGALCLMAYRKKEPKCG